MKAQDYADLYKLEEGFWWFVGMRNITAALLDPLCLPARDRLILDAGCGTGGMLSWLKRYTVNEKIFGVDLAHTALDFSYERGHKNLVKASVTQLPFADSLFDLVTSFDVLVQLPGEEKDLLAIREIHRVLRPGGIAFVRVAAYKWMMSGHDKALGTQRRYTLHELMEKMERAGFNVLRTSYANSFLFPVATFRRLLLKRIGVADSGSDVKPLPRPLNWLNHIFTGVLYSEGRLLKYSSAKLPFGLSAICVAEKPRD